MTPAIISGLTLSHRTIRFIRERNSGANSSSRVDWNMALSQLIFFDGVKPIVVRFVAAISDSHMLDVNMNNVLCRSVLRLCLTASLLPNSRHVDISILPSAIADNNASHTPRCIFSASSMSTTDIFIAAYISWRIRCSLLSDFALLYAE